MTVELRRSRGAAELAAWGFDRDGHGWWHRAACVETADLHTAELRSGWQSPRSAQAQARHICLTHCPAVEECLRDARRMPPRDLVQAGVVWFDGSQATIQPLDPGCGVWCAHLREPTWTS